MRVVILTRSGSHQSGVLIHAEALRQGKDSVLCLRERGFKCNMGCVRAIKPDWILVMGARSHTQAQLRCLAEEAKVAIWDADGLFPGTLEYWHMVRRVAPDLIISNSLGKAKRLRGFASNVVWVPQFYDAVYQRITEVPEQQKGIIFIGNTWASKRRKDLLIKLKKEFGIAIRGKIQGL